MPYARTIRLLLIGPLLAGALCTGCAPKQRSGAPPAAPTATQPGGSETSFKDAANTTQLEKPE